MKHNRFLRDFRSQIRSRFAEDSLSMPMSEWISRNTRLRKRPFSYDGFEFQRQIADDMHQSMYVIKCSQIGLTEVQIRKFLGFLKRNVGVSGIFTLPDDMMYKRVSQTRVKPIVESESVFNMSAEKPIRSMSLYQIDQSFGYFTGNKESDATSINADILFHDELDLSDTEIIALFQSRLQGSEFRITQSFSTPTFEGFGIHAGFQASDQHEYLCKCTYCRHYNIPAFTPDFVVIPGLSVDLSDFSELTEEMILGVDISEAYLRCESCGNRLNLADPELREWVPRFPGRRVRGYRVTPFATPRLTVEYIIDRLLYFKERGSLRRWYNTVLGEPFNESNARLSEVEIQAVMGSAARPEISSDTPIVIGIDVGITCHVVLMTVDGHVFEWRQVPAEELVDEVKYICDQYQVVAGGMDRHPYTPLSNEVRDTTEYRVLPIEYAQSGHLNIIEDELANVSHVRANRTAMIDEVVAAIRKQRTRFSGFGSYSDLIIEHLRGMVRIENEDKPAVWQKLHGNDHFFHALAYAFCSLRIQNVLNLSQPSSAGEMFSLSVMSVNTDQATLGVRSRARTSYELGSSR